MGPASTSSCRSRAGVKTVLLPSDRFDADEAWGLVAQWRITNMFTVPTIVKMLTEHPSVDAHDHSSLRYVIYAGAPMYREDQKHALTKLGKVLVQYFGLGEVTGNITVLPPGTARNRGRPGRRRSAPAATSAPGMQVSIQDEQGRELGAGRDGRDLRLRPGRVRRLLQQPGGQRESLPGRLVPHRRSRPHGRGGLPLHHRPRLGHVHLRRLERLSARDRGEDPDPSGHRRGRDPRRAGQDLGRGRRRGLRAAAGRGAERGGAAGVAGGQGRPATSFRSACSSGTRCRSPATARSRRRTSGRSWRRAAACRSIKPVQASA